MEVPSTISSQSNSIITTYVSRRRWLQDISTNYSCRYVTFSSCFSKFCIEFSSISWIIVELILPFNTRPPPPLMVPTHVHTRDDHSQSRSLLGLNNPSSTAWMVVLETTWDHFFCHGLGTAGFGLKGLVLNIFSRPVSHVSRYSHQLCNWTLNTDFITVCLHYFP